MPRNSVFQAASEVEDQQLGLARWLEERKRRSTRVDGRDDTRAVVPDHRRRVDEEDRDEGADRCDDEEDDVDGVRHRVARRVPRQARLDGAPDRAAHVEDDPEDGEEAALLALGRVGEDEAALRRPEEARTDAEDCSCCDDEAVRRPDVVVEERAHVPAAREERRPSVRAQLVVGEEGEEGKGSTHKA